MEWMRLSALLVEEAPELLHTISILPVLKEVHLCDSLIF
jgi:hypothetical protein